MNLATQVVGKECIDSELYLHTFRAMILGFFRMLSVWVDGFVRSVDIIKGDLWMGIYYESHKDMGSLTHFAAAQNAKWVCCSVADNPELPTSNISKSNPYG